MLEHLPPRLPPASTIDVSLSVTTSMAGDEPESEDHRVTDVCEHGTASHDGTEPSMASAPEASRAWLLIEHPGPWPHEPTEAVLPDPLGDLVSSAAGLGIRVQMIRRPGRRMGAAHGIYA